MAERHRAGPTVAAGGVDAPAGHAIGSVPSFRPGRPFAMLPSGVVLALQRSAGNRAVAGLSVSSRPFPAPSVPALPVQRLLAVQIRTQSKDASKIESVEVVGRPEGYFSGTMGDHTTAFAVHVEGVRVQLHGQTVAEGMEKVKAIAAVARGLPGTGLIDKLDEGHAQKYRSALTRLQQAEARPPTALSLQSLINAYLQLRELIPGSTINTKLTTGKFGRGKGEAKHVRTLANYELSQQGKPELLAAAINGLFDVTGVGFIAAETDPARIKAMAPGLTAEKTPQERAAMLWNQHRTSVQSSFPTAFAAAEPHLVDGGVIQMIVRQLERDVVFDRERAEAEVRQIEQARNDAIHQDNEADRQKLELFRIAREKDAEYWIARGEEQLKILKALEPTNPIVFDSRGLEARRTGTVVLGRRIVRAPRRELPTAPTRPPRPRKPRGAKRTVAEPEQGMKRSRESATPVDPQVDHRGPPLGDASVAEPAEKRTRTEAQAPSGGPQASVPAVVLPARSPFAVQLRVDAGIVVGMTTAGRPPSPFSGTMGAHTTAWVVHLDHVRSRVMKKSVAAAIRAVTDDLKKDAEQMADAAGASELSERHGRLYVQAHKTLQQLAGAAADKDDPLFLQEYLVALLAYVNLIPGATAVKVDTTGHGESACRKILRDKEVKFGGEVFEDEDETEDVTGAGEEEDGNQAAIPGGGASAATPDATMKIADEKEKKKSESGMEVERDEELRAAIRGLFDGKLNTPAWKNHLRIISRTYPNAFARSGYKV